MYYNAPAELIENATILVVILCSNVTVVSVEPSHAMPRGKIEAYN